MTPANKMERNRAHHRISVCYIVLIAWAALAFGAVYPWGYIPLLVGCAALGALSLILGGDNEAERSARPVAIGLVAVIGAVIVQLIPLPRFAVVQFSPATDSLLRQYSLQYVASDSLHPLSIRPEATWLALGFLAALGLFVLGAVHTLSSTSARTLVRGLLVLGVTLALIGIIQKATGTERTYAFWTLDASPFGTFGNKNHFAGWMLMVLPVGLAYFLALIEQKNGAMKHREWRKRILWFGSSEASEILLVGAAVTSMALALVLTLSRSGIGAFVFALVIIGWRLIPTQSTGTHRLFGAGCLSCLAVVSIEWTGTDSVIARFAALSGSDLAGRLAAWRDTIEIIKDFPLFGTGLNTYGSAMVFYQTTDFPNLWVWAHNDYLQIAAEGGLLLVIPAALLIGLFAREVRRRFRERCDDRIRYSVRIGAVTGVAAIALQDVVDFSLQIPANAVLFTLLCALAISRSPRSRDEIADENR